MRLNTKPPSARELTAPPAGAPLSLIRALHGRFVLTRRFRVLADALAQLLPSRAHVLDIGCGPGTIGYLLQQQVPGLSLRGLEVKPRPTCLIDYELFDGRRIPRDDASLDVCMFVDVLHHTDNIAELLREACRVTRRYLLIKDHLGENWLDRGVLGFMDWVGNRPHGVRLAYNYLGRRAWEELFASCALRQVAWVSDVPLYPFPFSLLFGRKLHFVALLEKAEVRAETTPAIPERP